MVAADEYDDVPYVDEHENWCRYPAEACICDYDDDEEFDDGSNYYYADPASDGW